MKKVIFLDFDGVLTKWLSDEESRKLLFCDTNSLNGDLAMLFQYILDSVPDLSVVISSSWRKLYSLDELKNILANLGIDSSRIIGVTATLPGKRGNEIRDWLNRNPEYTSFVILDDEADMMEYVPFLIQTESLIGLTKENADAVISLLLETK